LGVQDPLVLQPAAQSYLDTLYDTVAYADRGNDPAFQPPYVYRPFLPILAGTLGHVFGLKVAFVAIGVVSAFVLALASGLAVRKLTSSILFASSASLVALWLPAEAMRSVVSNTGGVDVVAMAFVAVVIALLVYEKTTAAAVVAATGAPLVRETLLPLALCVALFALLSGVSRLRLWILAALPFLLHLLLRQVMPVSVPLPISAIASIGNPLNAVYLFLDTYGLVLLIVLGLFSLRVRKASIAFFPFLVFLLVVISSTLSVSRHWLVVWPAILIFGIWGVSCLSNLGRLKVPGVVLITVTVFSFHAVLLGLLPRNAIWILLGLQCLWLFATQLQERLEGLMKHRVTRQATMRDASPGAAKVPNS
jgi:hypothetical protein